MVAGLITLLLFTLNPSVKALAMGFQARWERTLWYRPIWQFPISGFPGRNETHGAVKAKKEKVFKEGVVYPFFDVILTKETK